MEPRVVIVGGGFGGLACAKALSRAPVRVTLVDARNYHLFTPLLYQVATALLNPSDITIPFRSLTRHWKNTRFRQDRVVDADFAAKRVSFESGKELDYDYLVLASGSTDNHFGNEALATHTISMKTLSEALQLRNRVLVCLEYATRAEDAVERARLLTFVVVGGGPTGVEYAGALSELLGIVLGRDYPEITREDARVLLVESNHHLLASFPEELGRYAEKRVAQRGVEVLTDTRVLDAAEGHVHLSDERRIDARTVVWSAGVRPNDPLLRRELERAPSARLCVDDHLQVADGVFAIGDLASVEWEGRELPMVSPPAMQGGRYVAARIADLVKRGVPVGQAPAFVYTDKGMMATIGRNHAVGVIRGMKFKGFLGWIAWLVVHLYYIMGFRNRIFVFSHWAWEYMRRDRPIRIIASSHADDVVGDLDE